MKTIVPVVHLASRCCGFLVAAILLVTLTTGCTRVRLEYPLLTEENSDGVSLEGFYVNYDQTGEDLVDAFELTNPGKLKDGKLTKMWTVKGWNEKTRRSLLAKSLGNSRYLVQLITTEGDKPSKIELGLGLKVEDELRFFPLSSSFAREAMNHPALRTFSSKISYDEKSKELTFDELAVAQHGDKIIEFFKSLTKEHFDPPYRIRRTTDKRLVDAFWSKQRRQEKQYAADKVAEVAGISPYDVMILDAGMGVFGYQKVIVYEIREEDPRVKVCNFDSAFTRWVNPQDLMSVDDANAKKAKLASGVLEQLFKPANK